MESVSIPVAIFAGVVSFASPCFLPIVPVFLTYLTGGPRAGEAAPEIKALTTAGRPGPDGFIRSGAPTPTPVRRERGPWWGTLNALVFVGGFTAAFMAFWLLVSLVGLSMGDHRGILRIAGGIILILLGLVTLGFFQAPGGKSSALGRFNSASEPTLRRSGLMGLAFAAAWSPCIGPVLGVILGLAMVRGTLGAGMVLLAAYCAGLGLPLVAMAAGVGGLQERLAWFSRHQKVLNIASGALLIVIGLLLATDLLAPLSNVSLGGR